MPSEYSSGNRLGSSGGRPRLRVAILSLLALGSLAGLAEAIERYFTIHIARKGQEQRLVVKLDAPYGSVDVRPSTGPLDVATIESLEEDVSAHNCQWSYGLRSDNAGMLHIGIGTDEGMLGQPPLAYWYARSGYSLASARQAVSDAGSPMRPSAFAFSMPPLAAYGRPAPSSRLRFVSTDAGTAANASAIAGTRIHLSRDFPIEFSANLGFGESSIDLSGLPITSAAIETGASQASIYCASPNPQLLQNCSVRAGIGSCTFTGISNLNANRFTFHGAVGSYRLGFEGRLTHNLDAVIEVGFGMCSLSIPATAARVQVFYDDGLLSSFSFSGLAERREGYYTSVGFDHSTSPTLTLHLSSGAGKISVNYH